jgi:hypothetical protein
MEADFWKSKYNETVDSMLKNSSSNWGSEHLKFWLECFCLIIFVAIIVEKWIRFLSYKFLSNFCQLWQVVAFVELTPSSLHLCAAISPLCPCVLSLSLLFTLHYSDIWLRFHFIIESQYQHNRVRLLAIYFSGWTCITLWNNKISNKSKT